MNETTNNAEALRALVTTWTRQADELCKPDADGDAPTEGDYGLARALYACADQLAALASQPQAAGAGGDDGLPELPPGLASVRVGVGFIRQAAPYDPVFSVEQMKAYARSALAATPAPAPGGDAVREIHGIAADMETHIAPDVRAMAKRLGAAALAIQRAQGAQRAIGASEEMEDAFFRRCVDVVKEHGATLLAALAAAPAPAVERVYIQVSDHPITEGSVKVGSKWETWLRTVYPPAEAREPEQPATCKDRLQVQDCEAREPDAPRAEAVEKPVECRDGCPPLQVCDWCQGVGGKDAPAPAVEAHKGARLSMMADYLERWAATCEDTEDADDGSFAVFVPHAITGDFYDVLTDAAAELRAHAAPPPRAPIRRD